MTKMTIDLADELHRELKVAVAKEGTTAKAVLTKCAEEFVKKVKKKEENNVSQEPAA